MKYLAGFYTLIAIVTIFLFPQVVLADTDVTVSNNSSDATSNVSVNSQSQGTSTVCINGKCTTSGGGGKSTVCINGQCSTTDDGNVDYNSPDGHTQIHIGTNTSSNSISISPKPTVSDTPVPTLSVSPQPSMTPHA